VHKILDRAKSALLFDYTVCSWTFSHRQNETVKICIVK